MHTVHDVFHAGITLEPMRCLNPECQDPEGNHVTYHDNVADAYCASCGTWQEEL